MNRALLWKDIGLLRDTIVAALALLAFSYVLAGALVYAGNYGEFTWGKAIAGGASLARFTTILISALIGGHVYGREREEYSINFLKQLPARGLELLLSKLIVSATVVALIWILSMAILILGFVNMGYGYETNLRVLSGMLGFFASGVAVFGTAWLASLFVTSAIGASFVSLMALVPIIASQAICNWAFDVENGPFFHWSAVAFMLALGVLSVSLSFMLAARELSGREGVFAGRFAFLRRPNVDTESEAAYSKPSALRAILWKDFQLMKTPLQLGLVSMALPYAVGLAGMGIIEGIPEYFRVASVLCTAFGAIVFAFWSGQVTSAEQSASTIAFSSYLPIPKHLSIVSKLVVTLCPATAIITANAVCLVASNNMIPGTQAFGPHFSWDDWIKNGFIVMGTALANGSLMAYSFSWFLGMHYRKPAVAIVPGIAAVPVCIMVWASLSSEVSQSASAIAPLHFVLLFSAGTILLAAAGIASGIALEYRRAVE